MAIPVWRPREIPAPHMLAIPRYVSSAERGESHNFAQRVKAAAQSARTKGEA